MAIETIVYLVGVVLTVGAVGGLAWVGFAEVRVRALRRSRLAGATVSVSRSGGSDSFEGRPGGAIAGRFLDAVRRLGQQSAVRDPAKVSQLRSRLMQAGFYNREAPVIFLGVKAAAMAVATLAVVLLL